MEDGKSEDEMNSGAFATKFNPTKWYRADLKFPCPLSNHQHEMSTCAVFFTEPRGQVEQDGKGKNLLLSYGS